MTVSAAYTPDTYAGTGSLDTFAITFEFLSDSDNVKVSIKNDTTGVITVQTAGNQYNVSGSNVVFTAGNIPASGETIIIELDPDFKQEADYQENSDFPAETTETALDKLTLEAQINKNKIDSSLKLDAEAAESVDTVLPRVSAAAVSDQYLKWDSAGTGFESFTLSSSAGIGNVVEDTSPQLGGDLDLNSFDITGTGDINITGTVTCSGNSTADTIRLTGTSNQVVLGQGQTYTITLSGTAVSSSKTVTIPNATDTLVGKATTDTLTNKTIDDDNNVIQNLAVSALKAGTDGELITWGADGLPTTVGAGISNQVLTSNGAGSPPTFQNNTQQDLGFRYINGFKLDTATDADRDIIVQSGACRDSSDTYNIELSGTLTKQIDANWSAGNNSGGFPSGLTLSADTVYHFFIIYNSTTDTVDAGFDSNLDASELLSDASGYDSYRRVGSIITDSGSNILPFVQRGSWFFWRTIEKDIDTTIGTTHTTGTINVPTGISVLALCNVTLSDPLDAYLYIKNTSADSQSPSTSNAPLFTLCTLTGGAIGGTQVLVSTNTSGNITYASTQATSTLRISTIGYYDFRGQDNQ